MHEEGDFCPRDIRERSRVKGEGSREEKNDKKMAKRRGVAFTHGETAVTNWSD